MDRDNKIARWISSSSQDHFLFAVLLEKLDEFREYLQETIELHPELFPPQISDGYRFYGMTYSQKQDMKLRRIQLLSSGELGSV